MKLHKKSVLICFSMYIVFVLLHIFLAQVAKTPLIFPDEARCMGIASKIATGYGSNFIYYGGYSVLISIAYLFSSDINVVYSIIQIINAFIDAFLPVLIFIFAGQLNKNLNLWIKTAAAVLISLYPHFLTSSHSALPEGLYAVLYMIFIILAYDVISQEKINIKKCIAAVILYGYMCFVHPRALLLIAVFAGFLIYKYCKKKGIRLTRKKVIAALLILLFCVIVFILFIRSLVGNPIYNIDRFAQLILQSLSPKGILNMIIGMISQYSYLVMATLGLIFFGMYALCKMDSVNRPANLFVLFAFLSVLLQSSVFLMQIEWADHVLYGRYNEGAMPAVLTAGIVFLASAFDKKSLKPLWISSLLSFGITYLFRHNELESLSLNIANVDSLYIYKLFLPSFQYGWTVIIFIVFYLIFYLIIRKWKKAGFVFLGLFFLFSALYLNYDHYPDAVQGRMRSFPMIEMLKQAKQENGGKLEVNYQFTNSESEWNFHQFRTYIPDMEIKSFREFDQLPYPDSNIIITTGPESSVENAKVVCEVKNIPLKMWVKNADPEFDLEHKGILDREAYRSSLTVELQESYPANSEISVPVTVQHRGSGMLWRCYENVRDVREAVRLSLRILDKNNAEIYATTADLSDDMKPGDEQVLTPVIKSWDMERLYQKYGDGEYTMRLELMQNFTAWFSAQGDQGALEMPMVLHENTVSFEKAEHASRAEEGFYHVRPYLLTKLSQQEKEKGYYVNNIINISDFQTRDSYAAIENIRLNAVGKDQIILQTRGENPYGGDIEKAQLKIKANGLECEFIEFKDDSYLFSLPDKLSEITSIEIESATYRPIDQTFVPGFLGYTDTTPKPYNFGLRAVKKLFGLNLDGRTYGIDIDQIYLK